MRKRPITRVYPGLEILEGKMLMSLGASAAWLAHGKAVASARGVGEGASGQVSGANGRPGRVAIRPVQGVSGANHNPMVSTEAVLSNHGYAVYRITNPNPFNNKLIPPFQHVNVQVRPPVPGQTYNVLYVAVRNGTAQTFNASDHLMVKFPGSTHKLPVLKGDQVWKPGDEIIFYVLTKKYYPVPNVVSSGFEFDLDGIYSAAIPGPSGIFLRVKYNPATFGRVLDSIVTKGPGEQGGAGLYYGLPDTAIYELLSAKTDRPDWGGYF